MTDQLSLALRRLTMRAADLNRERIPCQCPIGTTPERLGGPDDLCVGDLLVIEGEIRRLQAKHPADDDKPVTAGWIMDMAIQGVCFSERVEQLWNDVDDNGIPKAFPTRGHVRRLCVALGIPLPK